MLHTADSGDGRGQRTSMILKVTRADHVTHPGYHTCLKFSCENGVSFFLDIHEHEVDDFVKMISNRGAKVLRETEFDIP